MKPKKLIRKGIIPSLKEGEWEEIIDQDELNQLYHLKIAEETLEIISSDHKDIMEFVDLIQVAFEFCRRNGFSHEEIKEALTKKSVDKGVFGNIALNKLNPDNPSNKLYFEKHILSEESTFTRMQVEHLQNEVYKITGDGEVMKLFNKMIGNAAS